MVHAHLLPSYLCQGSHSTKVEAVVRTLKKIQVTDPGAKCLVFSTVTVSRLCSVTGRFSAMIQLHDTVCFVFSPPQWQSVLDIIAKALFDNNMEFSQINGIHKFQVQTNFPHFLLFSTKLFVLWADHTLQHKSS